MQHLLDGARDRRVPPMIAQRREISLVQRSVLELFGVLGTAQDLGETVRLALDPEVLVQLGVVDQRDGRGFAGVGENVVVERVGDGTQTVAPLAREEVVPGLVAKVREALVGDVDVLETGRVGRGDGELGESAVAFVAEPTVRVTDEDVGGLGGVEEGAVGVEHLADGVVDLGVVEGG